MKIIVIVLFALASCLSTQAQKIIKDKKRGKETFELTIANQPYKKYITNYVTKHATQKLWVQKVKTNCKQKEEKQASIIKLLVSFNYDGKVFVSNHYSSPNIEEWVDDEDMDKWGKQIADELEKIIKKQGVVKPPYDEYKKQYINDEIVVEVVWKYTCN
jgi:protoheme ferro-lyase